MHNVGIEASEIFEHIILVVELNDYVVGCII